VLEKSEGIKLKEDLANNIVEGIDTVLAFLNTFQPDLEQCLKMAIDSLVAEHTRLLQDARAHGLTDRDIEEIEGKALEDVLREHDVTRDNEGQRDLREAVRQFVTSNSYMHFCEKMFHFPPSAE
jgi:hypothetical protein